MSAMLGSVLSLMTRVLGSVFAAESWATWRAVLKAAFARPLTIAERAVVEQLTGRTKLPSRPVRGLWLLLGRRSGKSIIAALIAVWATCCRSYRLAPGEVGVFMVVAGDRRQARVIKRYVAGLLRAAGELAELLEDELKETITLKNGLQIEIHTCSFRSLRGYTCIGAAVDEVSFWSDENSANPDREVLIALRAAMASVPEAMLVALTTTYAHRGEVGRVFDKHYGNDASETVLVVKGPTLVMNPTIDRAVIDEAYEDDPIAAAAEYGAEFRRDVEKLVTKDVLDACVVLGRVSLPPVDSIAYEAFVDPAGGSGADSFTLAIGHQTDDGIGVLDLLLEQRPPFSPEATVAQFAEALKPYRVRTIVGDAYAGEWPREAFSKHNISYSASAKPKSTIYKEALADLNSRRFQLLDVARLQGQMSGLERRIGRGGRDSIDHAPGGHDDLANAALGVLVGLRGSEVKASATMFNMFTGQPITADDFTFSGVI